MLSKNRLLINEADHSRFLLFWHVLLCGIGSLGVFFNLFYYKIASPFFTSKNALIPYAAWAQKVLAINKTALLVGYLAGLVFIFVYVALALILFTLLKKNSTQLRFFSCQTNSQYCIYYILGISITNVLLLLGLMYLPRGLILLLPWLVIFFLPVWSMIFNTPFYQYLDKKRLILFISSLLIAFLILIIALLPYFKLSSLKISNDFLWVPEETKLDDRFVDNNEFIKQNGMLGSYHSTIIPSQASLEFIKKNTYELQSNILAGHYFHHQNAFLGPVNELLLGKNPAQISFLYGFGNTYFIAYLLSHGYFNTFEGYTALLYSFYFLYFLLFLGCCSILFRDIEYTAVAWVISIAACLFIGFETIRLAPGFNPLRHLLDLPLILLFYYYLYAKRFNFIYLTLAYAVSLLAVIASKESGVMMFASLSGATGLYILLGNKKYGHLIVVAASIISLLYITSFLNHFSLAESTSIYSFLGVSIATSAKKNILALFMFVMMGYYSLLSIQYKKGFQYKPFYLALFLFLYTQCLWTYYAWNTETGHLLATSPLWLLCFFFILKEWLTIHTPPDLKEKIMLPLGIFALLLLSMASKNYFTQEKNYDQIFKDHEVYQWNFKKAHFLSTMNPLPFAEAVQLIHQYSHDKAIYIISKYDNVLPYLAEKYTAMPYLELNTSLVTQREIETALHALLKAKPRYLFVDSDIFDNHLGDVVDPLNPLMNTIDPTHLSEGRVLVINELQNVFTPVQHHYRLLRRGYLISVYERPS